MERSSLSTYSYSEDGVYSMPMSKMQLSGRYLDEDEQDERNFRLKKVGREMDYQWIGPIDPVKFLGRFLSSGQTKSDFTNVRVVELQKVLMECQALPEDEFNQRVVSAAPYPPYMADSRLICYSAGL
jgi:hypothetical protein